MVNSSKDLRTSTAASPEVLFLTFGVLLPVCLLQLRLRELVCIGQDNWNELSFETLVWAVLQDKIGREAVHGRVQRRADILQGEDPRARPGPHRGGRQAVRGGTGLL